MADINSPAALCVLQPTYNSSDHVLLFMLIFLAPSYLLSIPFSWFTTCVDCQGPIWAISCLALCGRHMQIVHSPPSPVVPTKGEDILVNSKGLHFLLVFWAHLHPLLLKKDYTHLIVQSIRCLNHPSYCSTRSLYWRACLCFIILVHHVTVLVHYIVILFHHVVALVLPVVILTSNPDSDKGCRVSHTNSRLVRNAAYAAHLVATVCQHSWQDTDR